MDRFSHRPVLGRLPWKGIEKSSQALLAYCSPKWVGRPSLRQAVSQPLEGFGGADRDRTDDLRLAKPALSQLSYSPNI